MNARCKGLMLQSYQLHKFLPTMQRSIKYSASDSQISTKKQDKIADLKKQAISNGPDFEDFLSGNVGKQETWKDYSGNLVKTKEMKRLSV